MRFLFIASLHHPSEHGGEKDPRPARFPASQAQHFWVKALEHQGHTCAIFWRSAPVLPGWPVSTLRMTNHLTGRRVLGAIVASVPELNPEFRKRNRSLVDFARRFQPDAIVLIGGNHVILPATLRELKHSSGAALVYTCGTPPSVFSHRIERSAAGLYDLVLANDLNHAQEWLNLGAVRAEVLPMSAVDPAFHRRYTMQAVEQAADRCQIAFVGTLVPEKLYRRRIAALQALQQHDLGIWSVHEVPQSLRRFYRGPALGEAMMRALSRADLIINPHGDFMRYGGNMRLFEACGAGRLQLVDDCPAARRWFKPGTHLVTYRGIDELQQLAAYYLDHAPEREAIAAAGQAHVYAHHTYDQRMTRLVELVDDLR